MAKFVSTYEKPTPHIGLPEWYAKQLELRRNADVRKSEAYQLRDSGRTVRSECEVRTKWDTYLNDARLTDRLTELLRWRDVLEDSLQKLLSEIHLLSDEKANMEREIESISQPLRVASECIAKRDCRRGTELTYDEADTELKKELHAIACIHDTMTTKVQAAWEKLNRLENVRFELSLDVENKTETIRIDNENLELDNTCANISYKPERSVTAITRSITHEAWLDRCHSAKTMADNELSDCYGIREAMRVMRERAWNDIRAQQDTTDFTLRKRIYQTQKARNELDWQKLKVQKEMEALQKEITQLERALISKADALKCTQTRLDKRANRPGFELCGDEVESGLTSEVLQLKQTEADLMKTIEHAKESYNNLESLLMRIDKNLDDKQHSLNTDVMCLDMRATLKTGDRTRLPNETDRNIVLTHMEKEIPLES